DCDSFHDDIDNFDNSEDDWDAILEGKYDTHALADTGLNINILPYGIYVKIRKGEAKPRANKIKMLDHSKAEPIGILRDVLFQIGVTTILARFLVLDIPARGRDHSLTLLQFAKRLGLYFNQEVGEEGFETYFRGGLRSDEHFNAREYWLSISREEGLHLSRSHASTIRKPILRVLQKMISYVDEKERSWESKREHDLLRSVHYAYGEKDELVIKRGAY
ncbi:hypothetical protein Tco_1180085, partial [Tanacetum coccineum]